MGSKLCELLNYDHQVLRAAPKLFLVGNVEAHHCPVAVLFQLIRVAGVLGHKLNPLLRSNERDGHRFLDIDLGEIVKCQVVLEFVAFPNPEEASLARDNLVLNELFLRAKGIPRGRELVVLLGDLLHQVLVDRVEVGDLAF